MFTQITIIFCLACAASVTATTTHLTPGYLSSAYALGSQAEHTVRGYGGLSSFSKQAKAVDSPYSTVRKTDIRVTNDAAYAPAAVTYAHHGHAYATPAFTHHHSLAPATIAHPGYHVPAGTITYRGYAPAQAVHHTAPIGYHGTTHTISAAPKQVHHTVPVPVATHSVQHHGLGVSYSPATAVAHSTFSGYGVHYGY